MTDQTSGCPVAHSEGQVAGDPTDNERLILPTEGNPNQQWWPKRLNLRLLAHNPQEIRPTKADFDYVAAFNELDLAEVKKDIEDVPDHLPVVVAGRLRQLRTADHPHGLACCRHLPRP